MKAGKCLACAAAMGAAAVNAFVAPSAGVRGSSHQSLRMVLSEPTTASSTSTNVGSPAAGVTENNVMTTIPNENGHTVMDSPAFKFFDAALSIPLFHSVLFGVYRGQMADKAEKMGIPWNAHIGELKGRMQGLLNLQKKMTNAELTIPDYYYAPIHAYADGNLSWDSAMEEDLWSKLMIAPLFGNSANGDVLMRRDWLDTTAKYTGPVKKAVDLGSGTGLSLNSVLDTWPESEVTGIDMSTYKLAIHQSKLNDMDPAKGQRVTLFNNAAEATKQPSDTFDLATLCLVCHESPKAVSQAIFKEAFRILKSGGTFSVMDLDKDNLEILLTKPFVAAIYKQTEPYMGEYLALDIREALEAEGFQILEVRQSTPSHKSFICRKP